MLAATLHTHFNFTSEEGLGEGGALDASEGGEITGAREPHGARKGTVHRGGWRAGTLRVGENV